MRGDCLLLALGFLILAGMVAMPILLIGAILCQPGGIR